MSTIKGIQRFTEKRFADLFRFAGVCTILRCFGYWRSVNPGGHKIILGARKQLRQFHCNTPCTPACAKVPHRYSVPLDVSQMLHGSKIHSLRHLAADREPLRNPSGELLGHKRILLWHALTQSQTSRTLWNSLESTAPSLLRPRMAESNAPKINLPISKSRAKLLLESQPPVST